MSQAIIKTLTNAEGNEIIYPRTTKEAVYGLGNIDASIEAANNHISNKLNPHQISYPQLGVNGIATGGTGATNRKDAFNNILSLGVNPITSTSDDTASKWNALGNGIAWFDTPNCLNDQPGQWGFLINYVWDSDVFQIWHTQNAGPMLLRSGNNSGWDRTWRKVYEQKNVTISTSAPSGGTDGDIWIQYS